MVCLKEKKICLAYDPHLRKFLTSVLLCRLRWALDFHLSNDYFPCQLLPGKGEMVGVSAAFGSFLIAGLFGSGVPHARMRGVRSTCY